MRSCRWTVGFICYLALVFSAQLVYAAPAENVDSSTTQVSSPARPTQSDARTSRAASARPGANGGGGSHSERRSSSGIAGTSTTHSIIIPPTPSRTHPRPSGSTVSGHPFTPHTFHPPPPPTAPPPPPPRPPSGDKGQSPVALAFEILGGIVGLFILLTLARCYFVWRRTPAPDRVAGLINRHQLEREMGEMEQERIERLNQALAARRWQPPPPPYQPAPAYDTVVPSDSPTSSPSSDHHR